MSVYNSLSSFGRIWTLIGAIFATIVGIGLICAGLYFLFRKPDRDIVKGVVARINNDEHGICTGDKQYHCLLSIQYVYNGQNYMHNIDYSGSLDYVIGQSVDIYVLKTDPYNIVTSPPLPKGMMYSFIAVGMAMMLGGWFWYWASRKWKPVAAVEGASGLFSIIRRPSLF